MNTRSSVAALTVLVGLLTLGFWLPSEGWAQTGSTGGPLSRLSADFLSFDDTESFSDVGVYPNSTGSLPGQDGTVVYRKTVFVPYDQNVLYITFSGVGDTHGGAALWMSCRVNGARCNPGFGFAAGAPAGYVALNKLPAAVGTTNCNDGGGGFGDCHDNTIYATWCVPIPFEGGTFDLELRLATSIASPTGATRVFFETAHVYIDSNCITGNACEKAAPIL